MLWPYYHRSLRGAVLGESGNVSRNSISEHKLDQFDQSVVARIISLLRQNLAGVTCRHDSGDRATSTSDFLHVRLAWPMALAIGPNNFDAEMHWTSGPSAPGSKIQIGTGVSQVLPMYADRNS